MLYAGFEKGKGNLNKLTWRLNSPSFRLTAYLLVINNVRINENKAVTIQPKLPKLVLSEKIHINPTAEADPVNINNFFKAQLLRLAIYLAQVFKLTTLAFDTARSQSDIHNPTERFDRGESNARCRN